MFYTVLYYKFLFSCLAICEISYTCLPLNKDWDIAKDIYGSLELPDSVTELFYGR